MKQTIFIIAILLFELITYGQISENNDLKGFNNFLGQEKAKALNEAVNSFETFLETNFPDQSSNSDRIKEFLKQLSYSFTPDSLWKLNTRENIEILETWGKVGLRKEIWTFGYEIYEPQHNIHTLFPNKEHDTLNNLGDLVIIEIEDEIIPITKVDSFELVRSEEYEKRLLNSLSTNVNGMFLYGLSKYAPNDTIIQEYVEAKVMVGDISTSLIIAVLQQIKEPDEPFIKRIILSEIYYWIMKWDIKRKQKD